MHVLFIFGGLVISFSISSNISFSSECGLKNSVWVLSCDSFDVRICDTYGISVYDTFGVDVWDTFCVDICNEFGVSVCDIDILFEFWLLVI